MKNMIQRFALAALALILLVATISWIGNHTISSAEAEESASSTPEYASLFEGDRIINVNVTIDDADWESILASPLDKEYKSVRVEVDGHQLDHVGFSTKGNMTLRSVASMEDSDRYSFRLKFDKYDKTQTLLGLDKMVLNNNYSDPSYLQEYLHYEALRSIGLDVPMTTFVNLYVNGELFGFYTGVESVDDSYLERNYGEDYEEGILYDTDEKSYLQTEENGEYSTLTEDLGTDENKARLKNFIQVLNDMPEGEKGDIESVLDVDSALKYIAGNVVLGNYDSYNGDKGHNYMLYGDANGKFTVIPWDFNMSFNGYGGGRGGTSSDSGASGSTNATNVSIEEPVLGISMDKVPMINNLLAVPEYKAQYLEYVNQLVDYLESIEGRITELSDLIRPSVETDPTKFYTMEQFESNIAYSAVGDMGDMKGGSVPPSDGSQGMTPPDGTVPTEDAGNMASSSGGASSDGQPGMTPPEDFTPPGGVMAPPARPDGTAGGENGNRPSGNGGDRGSMGLMASGSITSFALNRLANLQEQLGREVVSLPAAMNTDAASVTSD